jgi:hypothetical protein
MLPEQPSSHRRRALLFALAAGVIVFVLWNVPQLSQVVLYPFRLFVTYVHEAGHGSMAVVTGGRFLSFEIMSNGAGQALTAGGFRPLILPAGYLGAALFGAVLFYLTNTLRYSRSLSVALGIGLLFFSVMFGRFSLTAFVVGIVFGGVLILLGWKASRDVNLLLLNMLAILTGLNAVLDLFFLVGNSGVGIGNLQNDAAAFSREVMPLVPAAVWALLWAVIAVILLGAAVWLSLIRPMRKSSEFSL